MGTMRRIQEPMLAGAVTCVLAVTALGLWMNRGPALQWHAASAKVVAIASSQHRFHPEDSYVVVRNPHGTGQFTIHYPPKCVVGDTVPVEQAGISLRAAPSTCR